MFCVKSEHLSSQVALPANFQGHLYAPDPFPMSCADVIVIQLPRKELHSALKILRFYNLSLHFSQSFWLMLFVNSGLWKLDHQRQPTIVCALLSQGFYIFIKRMELKLKNMFFSPSQCGVWQCIHCDISVLNYQRCSCCVPGST